MNEMEKSYLRGHEIEKIDGEWVFSDTKEPTVKTWHKRPCGYCGEYNTPEGHDGCLGTLPAVMNACCGHGQTNEAYVQFWDGFSVHGKDAITIMQILKQSRTKLRSKEKGWNKMTWIELVKKYFPNISDEEADFILWGKTAFPMGGLKVVEEQLKELSNSMQFE